MTSSDPLPAYWCNECGYPEYVGTPEDGCTRCGHKENP